MMRSRVTTRVVTFVLIALTTTVMSVLQVIPAQASHTRCGRHSWVRSTVLHTAPIPHTTEAEVQEEAGWYTRGHNRCWGSGISGFLQHAGGSRCYNGPLVTNELVSGTCRYSLTGAPWYVREGVQQYYDMTATIWATYRNSVGMNYTNYTLYGRFKIRYDGTYTRNCWFSGTITYPYETDCNSGGILSGR
jgi:hypothetical protein